MPAVLADPIAERKTAEVHFEKGARLVATKAERERWESYNTGDAYVSLEEMKEKMGGRHVVHQSSAAK